MVTWVRAVAMSAFVLAVCVSSCGDGDEAPPSGTPTADSAYTIVIALPEDGSSVAPLFDLAVDVTGVELALGPNDELVSGAAHWHVATDGAGLPFAYDEDVTSIGPLAPGAHTIEVSLYLNDADSVAVASDSVSITVSD